MKQIIIQSKNFRLKFNQINIKKLRKYLYNIIIFQENFENFIENFQKFAKHTLKNFQKKMTSFVLSKNYKNDYRKYFYFQKILKKL